MNIITIFSSLICAAIVNGVKNTSAPNQLDDFFESKQNPNGKQNDFKKFFSVDEYDRLLRPNYFGKPTVVTISLTIASFGKLNFELGTLRLNLYLRQSWVDYRYKHNFTKSVIPFIGKKHPSDFLWVPDTVLIHTQKAKIPKTSTSSVKLDIQQDGTVLWGLSISADVRCDVDLRNYPMDFQTCKFGFESYALPARHIIYKFSTHNNLTILSKTVPQFLLMDYQTENKTQTYVAGNFSTLRITFVVKREVAVMLMNTFMPSVALVAVSWVSLWVHKKSTSARLGTGITTLLTLTGIWLTVNRRIPGVSYLKAIDLYFIVSFLFIFLTMVEYAVVAFVNFPLWKMKRHVSNVRKHKAHGNAQSGKSSGAAKKAFTLASMYEKKKKIIEDRTQHFLQYLEQQKPAHRDDTALSLDVRKVQRSFLRKRSSGLSTNSMKNGEESSSGGDSDDSSAEVKDIKSAHLYNPKPATLDIISRFMFPFCYLAFLIWFWNHYMSKFELEYYLKSGGAQKN